MTGFRHRKVAELWLPHLREHRKGLDQAIAPNVHQILCFKSMTTVVW